MVTQGELRSILAFATAGRINEKHKQTIKSNTILGFALRFICSKFEDNGCYAVLATILRILYAMNTGIKPRKQMRTQIQNCTWQEEQDLNVVWKYIFHSSCFSQTIVNQAHEIVPQILNFKTSKTWFREKKYSKFLEFMSVTKQSGQHTYRGYIQLNKEWQHTTKEITVLIKKHCYIGAYGQ